LAAYLPAYTDRNRFWTLDGDSARWLGVFLFAVGGTLRIWPGFMLGRRFSGLVGLGIIPSLGLVVAQVTDGQEGHEWIRGGEFQRLLGFIAAAAAIP